MLNKKTLTSTWLSFTAWSVTFTVKRLLCTKIQRWKCLICCHDWNLKTNLLWHVWKWHQHLPDYKRLGRHGNASPGNNAATIKQSLLKIYSKRKSWLNPTKLFISFHHPCSKTLKIITAVVFVITDIVLISTWLIFDFWKDQHSRK